MVSAVSGEPVARDNVRGRGRWSRNSAFDGEDGLRAAYAAHGDELYRLALRALGDSGLAEEAVQETFLRAWRASGRYESGRGSLRTWLFAICRNTVVDLARSRRARPDTTKLEEGFARARRADDPTEEPIEGALDSWEMEEALRNISINHRKVILETYYRGRSSAEVAAELGVPEGTVRSRLFYGLKALRLALDERGWRE